MFTIKKYVCDLSSDAITHYEQWRRSFFAKVGCFFPSPSLTSPSRGQSPKYRVLESAASSPSGSNRARLANAL